jgi:hypothetical protein
VKRSKRHPAPPPPRVRHLLHRSVGSVAHVVAAWWRRRRRLLQSGGPVSAARRRSADGIRHCSAVFMIRERVCIDLPRQRPLHSSPALRCLVVAAATTRLACSKPAVMWRCHRSSRSQWRWRARQAGLPRRVTAARVHGRPSKEQRARAEVGSSWKPIQSVCHTCLAQYVASTICQLHEPLCRANADDACSSARLVSQ